jgi:hypothetical protein
MGFQGPLDQPEERIFAMMKPPIIAAALALSLSIGMPQEKPQQKASQEDQRHQGVAERGDQVMGFSHDKTAHHFRLYADGGAIEAEANDAQDTANRDAIRAHFGHIARMFADGEFSAPMLIHKENPPGTEEMKRLHDAIHYNLENTERGARVRITTKNPEALEAIHKFLRFQIADHQTGDATEITKVP